MNRVMQIDVAGPSYLEEDEEHQIRLAIEGIGYWKFKWRNYVRIPNRTKGGGGGVNPGIITSMEFEEIIPKHLREE